MISSVNMLEFGMLNGISAYLYAASIVGQDFGHKVPYIKASQEVSIE